MRRPQPLPTPPRRETASPVAASGEAAPRQARPPARSRPEEPIVVSPDDVETAVDLPTFESWTAPGVDPEAETQQLDDTVLLPEEPALAPVTSITSVAEDPDPAPRGSSTSSQTDASAPDDEPAATGWRDVWRASRAHRGALRREARRFTARSRRRRLTWIVSLSAIVAVVVGSLAVAYSPLFAVEKISVAGATTTLDPATVQKALQGQIGAPLAAIDRAAIKKDLAAFPVIETYSLEAKPPHELVVRIVERTPVGVVTANGGYDLVDAAGVVLSTSAEAPAGQPVISVEGGIGSEAFRAVGSVIRAVPASIHGQLSAASATTAYDVTLTLAGTGTTIVWGSAEDSVEKALVLEKIMAARPATGVALYDVSSPGNVIVR